MGKFTDLIGQRFGRLTVIKRVENDKKQNTRWLCQCDCGAKKVVLGYRLTNNHAKSCGCVRRKFSFDSVLSDSRLYRCYRDMKRRCFNKNFKSYKSYGGRGITICEEWKDDFMAFYNWAMANDYSDSLTLDRIDVNGNYEPNNCRWATRKQQCNNFRKNKFITYNGETKTISEWADFFEVNYRTFYSRLYRGWDIEKAKLKVGKK